MLIDRTIAKGDDRCVFEFFRKGPRQATRI
jgi:hypothetical protein